MSANKDSEPRQRVAQQRAVDVPDIDLDGFLIAAEAATTLVALTGAFAASVDRAGFSRAQYMQIIDNFERVPVPKAERLVVGEEAPDLSQTKQMHFDADLAITNELAQLRAYTWRDLARRNELSPATLERIADYERAGFVDGVTVPVSLHAGDIAAFIFFRRQAVFAVSNPGMLKLQFFCHAMHKRFAALAPPAPGGKLSRREIEVMTLVAVGRTNAEIAGELGISVHTVNTLVRRCFLKLGVSNRVEAASRFAYLARGK